MGWIDDVTSHLVWLAKSHQRMYDDIHGGLGAGAAQGTVEHYDCASRKLQEIHERIERGVRELSANWSGTAAAGATALTKASADWAAAAAVAASKACELSVRQVNAFVDARNRMPEPVPLPDISPSGGFPAAKLTADFVRAKERADAAHQEAARVMTGYQTSTNQHLGSLPEYPPLTTLATVAATDTPGGHPRGGPVPGPRPPVGQRAVAQPPPGVPPQQQATPAQAEPIPVTGEDRY
ncbi:hypothetical protein KIPE111705_44905 [Kibdelosporangium persicum]|uniref:PPE family protein n=1 Tax=Kibdelosporangium persicum TaxID=2698649 RepID=A0ABX2FAI8_9PSEU|nr:hypothetical protein [Kibdelosporangium persicum]NRN68391.1 hypothetical protein [Kibdelosporangium persicum]